VQLPDLKALFKKIDENQKAIHKIKENYAGTRTEEETEYDGSGKVKKVETSQFTFFYMDGEEVSTLVQKDGKAAERGRAEKRKRDDKKTDRGIAKARNKKRS